MYLGKPKILNISSNIRSLRTVHASIFVALKLRLKEVSLLEVGPRLSDSQKIQSRGLGWKWLPVIDSSRSYSDRSGSRPWKKNTRFYHFRTHQDGQLYCGWCQHPSERLCHYVAAYRHHRDSSCHSICSSCTRVFWKIWTQTRKFKVTLFCKSNCEFLFLLGLTEMWTAINCWFILPSYFCGDPVISQPSDFRYFMSRCEKPRLGWLAKAMRCWRRQLLRSKHQSGAGGKKRRATKRERDHQIIYLKSRNYQKLLGDQEMQIGGNLQGLACTERSCDWYLITSDRELWIC